jgi:hypothetical protein
MSEMAHKMEHVPLFHEVIHKYALFCLSFTIDKRALERALRRITVDDVVITHSSLSDPYFICFRNLLDSFVRFRALDSKTGEQIEKFIPVDKSVDFYFDEQTQKKVIRSVWAEIIEKRAPEVRELYGSEPKFENDEIFLPLQAADFWAWWIRKGHENGNLEDICNGDFGKWKAKPIPGIHMGMGEDQLAHMIMQAAVDSMPPGSMLRDTGLFTSLLKRFRRFFQEM